MIKLRTVLQAYLKTIHPSVYFQIAPENAQFPYIIFNFQSLRDDGETMQTAVIDIDGWDLPSNGDTTAIEILMQQIYALNKTTLTAENMAVTFYLDNKILLEDDDKRIKRRKYVYQAKIIEGS